MPLIRSRFFDTREFEVGPGSEPDIAASPMSALPRKADIKRCCWDICFVPDSDQVHRSKNAPLGTIKLSALAVFKLMKSSNLVGCWDREVARLFSLEDRSGVPGGLSICIIQTDPWIANTPIPPVIHTVREPSQAGRDNSRARPLSSDGLAYFEAFKFRVLQIERSSCLITGTRMRRPEFFRFGPRLEGPLA
jgi:hypothetical protein